MKRFIAILAVVILLLTTTVPAIASWSWCASDPEVILPDGQGSLYVWVSVPEANASQPVTLHLMVPRGSRVLNHAGEANIQVITHLLPQDSHSVVARVNEDFPVRLSAIYQQTDLRAFTFERGKGAAFWRW